MVNEPDTRAPGLLSRWAAHIGVALVLLSLGGLLAIWAWDRTRTWETPRYEPARFVELAPPDTGHAVEVASFADPTERWLVPVNPGCQRCRRAFPAILARRDSTMPRPRLEVLIVDAPRRPDPSALAAFPADGALWDSAGIWRGRWGHRAYGEVLRFHATGVLDSVLPPPADP